MYLNGKKIFILYMFKRESPPIASPGRFGNWNTPSLIRQRSLFLPIGNTTLCCCKIR